MVRNRLDNVPNQSELRNLSALQTKEPLKPDVVVFKVVEKLSMDSEKVKGTDERYWMLLTIGIKYIRHYSHFIRINRE